jgi:hypothetical protein
MCQTNPQYVGNQHLQATMAITSIAMHARIGSIDVILNPSVDLIEGSQARTAPPRPAA